MKISGVTYVTQKSNKMKYIIISTVVLLLLISASTAIISAYNGWRLLHPGKKGLETISSGNLPAYTNANFTGKDKSIKLSGWYFKAKASDKTVILVHSYGSNRMQFGNQTIDLINDLLKKDYNVLAFDLRGSGKSGGRMSTFGFMEKDDVDAAVKWAGEQGSNHITLFGFSTGASASILAAAENDSVEAVIADDPYTDLKSYLNQNIKKWTSLPAFPFNMSIIRTIELLSEIDTDKASPFNALLNEPAYKLMIISQNSCWDTEKTCNISSYTEVPSEYSKKVMHFLETVYNK